MRGRNLVTKPTNFCMCALCNETVVRRWCIVFKGKNLCSDCCALLFERFCTDSRTGEDETFQEDE